MRQTHNFFMSNKNNSFLLQFSFINLFKFGRSFQKAALVSCSAAEIQITKKKHFSSSLSLNICTQKPQFMCTLDKLYQPLPAARQQNIWKLRFLFSRNFGKCTYRSSCDCPFKISRKYSGIGVLKSGWRGCVQSRRDLLPSQRSANKIRQHNSISVSRKSTIMYSPSKDLQEGSYQTHFLVLYEYCPCCVAISSCKTCRSRSHEAISRALRRD